MNKTAKETAQPEGGVTVWLIKALLIAALFVPLAFIPQLYDIYDLTKATYVRLLAILLIVMFLLHILLRERVTLLRSPLFIPIGAFVALTVISSVFSINPIISTVGGIKRHEGWVTFVIYGLLLVGAATYFRRSDLNKISSIFAAVISVMSVYGIAQRFGYDFMDFGQATGYDLTRAFATTGNPVFLGTLLSVAVPYFAVMVMQPRLSPLRRALYGAAAGLGAVACVFTYSRGAWLGLIAVALVGLPLLLWVFGWRRIVAAWKPALAVAAAIGLLLGMTTILKPASSQFSDSVAERAAAALNVSEGSSGTRLEMWRSTLNVVAEKPVLGWGLETFSRVFPEHRSLKLIQLEGEFAMPDRPHNEMLYIASSMGLVGVAAAFWLFIAFFWFSVRWLKQRKWKDEASPSRFAIAAVTLALFGNLVAEATSFTTINTTAVMWLLLGMAVALASSSADYRTIQLPAMRSMLRYPLYALLLVWTVFMVQYTARFLIADYNYNNARFSRAYNQIPAAQREAEAAVVWNPYFSIYRVELGAIYTDIRTRTGDVNWRRRSAEVYEEAVAFDERDEDSWANLGNAYLDLAQSGIPGYLDKAVHAFRQAIAVDPYFSVAHIQLGSIYLAEKKYDLAATELEAAVEVAPKAAESWMLLAESYTASGRPDDAIRAFKQVLTLNPSNEVAKTSIERLKGSSSK